jgi:uncharacterized paraquat-inducible protein A
MYAKVPEHLKDPLLRELRRLRLRSAFKHFPALVLICSSITALVIFAKGHAIIEMLRDYIPLNVPDATLAIIALGVIVAVTAAFLVFFLRQQYHECEYQECLFCPKCEAVDRYDSGCCPICQTPLTERASFYFTTYKDEQKIIERWGLQPSR